MDIETNLELELISRFVVKEKRDRLLGFASSFKTRPRLLSELKSPAIFDPRYVIDFSGADRMQEVLPDIYKTHGMGGRVYVISENEDWDARRFQMSYIVNQCLGACIDTLGYCWKSRTAFYEWHHSGKSYLLRRP